MSPFNAAEPCHPSCLHAELSCAIQIPSSRKRNLRPLARRHPPLLRALLHLGTIIEHPQLIFLFLQVYVHPPCVSPILAPGAHHLDCLESPVTAHHLDFIPMKENSVTILPASLALPVDPASPTSVTCLWSIARRASHLPLA